MGCVVPGCEQAANNIGARGYQQAFASQRAAFCHAGCAVNAESVGKPLGELFGYARTPDAFGIAGVQDY